MQKREIGKSLLWSLIFGVPIVIFALWAAVESYGTGNIPGLGLALLPLLPFVALAGLHAVLGGFGVALGLVAYVGIVHAVRMHY
jgi:hypothetical protein